MNILKIVCYIFRHLTLYLIVVIPARCVPKRLLLLITSENVLITSENILIIQVKISELQEGLSQSHAHVILPRMTKLYISF